MKQINRLFNNCFFSHKWGKWEQYKTRNITYLFDSNGTEFIQSMQRRNCERCNKQQVKKIK